jgi:hypothetical protein
MNEISIERLSLQVPGLSKSDGQRLAQQVAEGLGSMAFSGDHFDIPGLRLDLTATPNAGLDELARQILAEVMRQIERHP